jgi:hypothetical protein
VLVDYAHFDASGLTIADHPGIYRGNTAGASDSATACGYIEGGSDHSYLVAACPDTQVIASTCGTSSFDSILTSRQFGSGYMECTEDYNSCSDARGATLTTYNSTLLQIDVDSASSDESGEYELFLSF